MVAPSLVSRALTVESLDRVGRPTIDRELRDLIRRMSRENPLWGAPRIHCELLKLGFEVAQSTKRTGVAECLFRLRYSSKPICLASADQSE